MRRLLHHFAAAAALIRLTSGASTPTATSTTFSAAPTVPGVEVDIIYPIANAFYNITESLPVIFALQNLSAAAAFGPVIFEWYIMPYGKVGEKPQPGGVTNEEWQMTFNATNAPAGPFILVNQTNVVKWPFGPYYPDGSVYALMWTLGWSGSSGPCQSRIPLSGTLFFNINITRDEPDLAGLAGHCPQFGGRLDFDGRLSNSSCESATAKADGGNPCAVTVDAAVVTSMSSAVRSLVTASSLASAGPTPTPSPKGNAGAALRAPSLYSLVFGCNSLLLLGGMSIGMTTYY